MGGLHLALLSSMNVASYCLDVQQLQTKVFLVQDCMTHTDMKDVRLVAVGAMCPIVVTQPKALDML